MKGLDHGQEKPERSKGVLSRIAESDLGKKLQAGTAAAMLYGAVGATGVEAAPKQKTEIERVVPKKQKAPESAKKASPADQLREKRQKVEKEAARMLVEKQILGQLAAENVSQEILQKIGAAKSGRDFEYISYEKTYKELGVNQKFLILEYINTSRHAKDPRTIEGIFSGLRGLPLSEKVQDFALKVVPNMRWQEDEDPHVVVLGRDRHLLAAERFIKYVLDTDLNKPYQGEHSKKTKDWVEKMLKGIARNTPREKLMEEVVSPIGKYLPYLHGGNIDIASLIRSSYKRESLADMGKKFIEKIGKGPELGGIEKYEKTSFFRSDYWKYLLPEEKLEFVQKYNMSPYGREFVAALMRDRDNLMQYDRSTYQKVLDDLARIHPDALLRAFVTQQLSVNREDFAAVKKALADPRITSDSRFQFAKEHLWSQYTEEQRELVRLLRPEELLIIRDRSPSLWNIQDDVALKNIGQIKKEYLPKNIQGLSLTEVAQWQVMIARNLYFQNKSIDLDSVRGEADRIQSFREKYKSHPLFGNTVVAAHEEMLSDEKTPRFGKPALISGIRAHVNNVKLITPHIDPGRGNFKVTADSLRDAKQQVTDRIIRTPVSVSVHFTFLADTHGGGSGDGAIYLSDGVIEDTIADSGKERHRERVTETERTTKITSRELADAFIKRYQDPQKREAAQKNPDVVILSSCYSSNIARNFAEILKKANVPIPIIIAMAEYGQFGWSKRSSPPGSDFTQNTILQEWRKGHHKGPPNVEGVIEYDQRQESSNPVLFVPDDNGNYMQLSDAEWFAHVRTNVG